jgi:prepilin-type N-terminal cleavage/methylation domain-containing protein
VPRQQAHKASSDQSGFTLIETIAAFAIGSVVILSGAALLHNVAFSFDHGANRVSNGERLAVAAERLASDIGSAGYVLQKTSAGAVAAFTGGPTRMIFISLEGADAGLQRDGQPVGQEVVSLTAEPAGDATQIVRRRAPWPGPRTPFDTVALKDDVVLLEGTFDAAFSFARVASDGTLSWADSWTGERTLPHLVKLTLRDRATGGDLLGGAEFTIRADAPSLCAAVDAGLECLSGTAQTAQSSQAPAPQGQGTSPATSQATSQGTSP